MTGNVVNSEVVEKTIAAFTRLDQRGDKRAMNKLAQRLQKEQPFLLAQAAAVRTEHGDAVGEAAVFYATLVWAMFDRLREETLPRLTQQNLSDADRVVTEELSKIAALTDKPIHERVAPGLVATQPHIYAKLAELIAEDVKPADGKDPAMTEDTAATIFKPTQVVVEAFDAALSGRRPGERQGTIVASGKVGRNEPCPCGSGKKYKKCHGEAA
jgi:preprotein translocase subunit SecA